MQGRAARIPTGPNTTKEEVYNRFFNYLNGIPEIRSVLSCYILTRRPPQSTLDSGSINFLDIIIDDPVEFWTGYQDNESVDDDYADEEPEPEPLWYGNMVDDIFSCATTEQLRNYIVTIPGVDADAIRTLIKDELVHYYHLILIATYHQRHDEEMTKLRRNMENNEIPNFEVIDRYLSRDDFATILDEFSIEYPADATIVKINRLILDYIDLMKNGKVRDSSNQLRSRKLL